jgi:hypothetical protein
MATQKPKIMGSLDGTSPIYREFPVNNSQTIKKGDIVVLSSNKASIAADAAASGTVIGISATALTTTTATAADLILVDVNPATIYKMSYTGSAVPAVGDKHDMGTASYQFDSDDTDGGYIQVVGNVDSTNKYADVILCNRVFGMA